MDQEPQQQQRHIPTEHHINLENNNTIPSAIDNASGVPITPRLEGKTLREALETLTCADLVGRQDKIFEIRSSDSVYEAFERLIAGGVLSAPLYDPIKKEYIGFVDYLDLVAFTTNIYTSTTDKFGHNWYKLLESEERFATKKVSTISDISHRNPYIPLNANSPAIDAVRLFIDKAIHRVPLLNNEGQLVGILTQSAVITFLCRHVDLLGDKRIQTITQLNLGTAPVVTVTTDVITIEAFNLMYEKGISGLGVVDEKGILIGNLSARDLKFATHDVTLFAKLTMDVGTFIKTIHQDRVSARQPAISCKESTTLDQLISRLRANRIHRMYVVDDHFKPTRALSLRDIIKIAAQ